MATALDIINRSMRLIGVLESGETATASEAQDALAVLNEMLDAWNLESLVVFSIDALEFTLVVNQGTYTVGVGGNFNTTRPVKIESVTFRDITQTPNLDIPLRTLNDDDYESIGLKALKSTWPQAYYYDRAYPLGNLFLWPVPTLANKIVLNLWHPLTQIAALSTTVDLPPGYRRALQYNLAVELAAEYSATITAVVAGLALASKAQLKDTNAVTPELSLQEVPMTVRGGIANDLQWV